MFPLSRFTAAQSIRCVLVPIVLTSVFFPALYQSPISHLWAQLQKTSMYNWSTFETIWTVICYAAIEVPLTSVFMHYPEWRLKHSTSKPRGMRRPARRLGEALVYIAPLLTMDLILVKKFAGVPLNDMLASGNYAVREGQYVPPSGSLLQPRHTFLVPTLHNFSWSSPLQTIRAIPLEAPSSRRLVMELLTSFLIYDTLFFLFHLSLHVIKPLRRWHAPHHSHDAQLNPQVTNQLSVFERLGLVLLANFSLNIIRAHVLTRTIFVPVFVWLLIEIHSGMDLPWGYDKLLPQGWGGGAEKHMRHHSTGDSSYEPFFCWWDRLLEKMACA